MNTLEISVQDSISFQNFVLRFYQKHGRHELPWRQTDSPYHILVSDLMLQQTQVARVIPKYEAFMQRFPSISTLAQANLSEVLTFWQGLGYNRRAKFLWQLAEKIENSQTKEFPKTESELQQLPGVGPYTASAILSFAYNQPTTIIETNVRTVFLHHFFPMQTEVPDSKLLPLIKQTLYTPNPSEWYWALMDYGAYLKKILPNPSRKSKHHIKQSIFKGSLRQVRGEIIRILVQKNTLDNESTNLTVTELKQKITGNKIHFEEALSQLIAENLIKKIRNSVTLE